MSVFLWNLFSLIIALGILIFVHEYGHFWVARRNGVKVLKFAIGFGKPIYSWFDKQGTQYSIGLIPLGGYVRMLDERIDDVADEDKDRTFNGKRVGQRIAIVAAGPMANFIFAIVALFIMFLVGVPKVKPVIGEVFEPSIAYEAGLQFEDEITAINGKSVTDWEMASFELVASVGNETTQLDVLRNGYAQTLTLDTADWSIEQGNLFDSLGFNQYRPSFTLGVISEGSAAERFGLQVGDRILTVNEQPIHGWFKFGQLISNNPDEKLAILLERNGEQLELTVVPDGRLNEQGFSQGFLGVSPKFDNWPKGYVFDQQYAILPALQNSLEKTWALGSLIFTTVGKLITGDLGLSNLSGPIAIAQGAGISAQGGLVFFLSFLALISVNLGVVNLLPLPVLDGGHLMYFFIELIRGKPVSERVQEIGFRIGAFVLMMIMGIAIINDFARL